MTDADRLAYAEADLRIHSKATSSQRKLEAIAFPAHWHAIAKDWAHSPVIVDDVGKMTNKICVRARDELQRLHSEIGMRALLIASWIPRGASVMAKGLGGSPPRAKLSVGFSRTHRCAIQGANWVATQIVVRLVVERRFLPVTIAILGVTFLNDDFRQPIIIGWIVLGTIAFALWLFWFDGAYVSTPQAVDEMIEEICRLKQRLDRVEEDLIRTRHPAMDEESDGSRSGQHGSQDDKLNSKEHDEEKGHDF